MAVQHRHAEAETGNKWRERQNVCLSLLFLRDFAHAGMGAGLVGSIWVVLRRS
jgi:hypothetical protein